MDLKTFAEEEFDPNKSTNKAWSGGENQEKEIAKMVAILQLYMKQLSDYQDETAKTNAASALKEADKWVARAQSLEDTLDFGVPTQRDKLSALAEQVAAMTLSLETMDPFISCPYNATHRVPNSKLKQHVVDCPSRKEIFPENKPATVIEDEHAEASSATSLLTGHRP